MGKFVAKGDVVMIKPNIGWDRTPEMAACTNPEVVRTLVEMSLAAGAKKVMVMDNTTNQAQRCYARSGIQAAAKAAGADVPFVNPRRVKKMAIKGEWLKDWDVIQDFVEADKLINVPIAKHHSLCRVTLGMKNWLGAIGDPRNQLHQKLDEAMVDLHGFFKPTLTVLDAYRILVRNGPQGGRPSDTKLLKTVVAGRDGVAVDAMGATFFDIAPADLRLSQAGRPARPGPDRPGEAGPLKKERSKKHRALQLLRIVSPGRLLRPVPVALLRDPLHRPGLHRQRRGLLPLRPADRGRRRPSPPGRFWPPSPGRRRRSLVTAALRPGRLRLGLPAGDGPPGRQLAVQEDASCSGRASRPRAGWPGSTSFWSSSWSAPSSPSTCSATSIRCPSCTRTLATSVVPAFAQGAQMAHRRRLRRSGSTRSATS